MAKFMTSAELDSDDIVCDLTTSLDYDELFDFIKIIDEGVADWDFTEKLYKHFSKLHKKYLKECKKDIIQKKN
jgi:hypothetical protein